MVYPKGTSARGFEEPSGLFGREACEGCARATCVTAYLSQWSGYSQETDSTGRLRVRIGRAENGSIMSNTKKPFLFVFLLFFILSAPSFGQQRVFNWLPGNDESVRLDPANYHARLTYHPAGNGGNIQVDIKAQQPVTIFLARAAEWNEALKNPEGLGNLQQLCQREHV